MTEEQKMDLIQYLKNNLEIKVELDNGPAYTQGNGFRYIPVKGLLEVKISLKLDGQVLNKSSDYIYITTHEDDY